MTNNDVARLGLIVIAACVFLFLIHTYNNGSNNNAVNNRANNSNVSGNEIETFYADGEQTENAPNNGAAQNLASASETESEDEPMPSEGEGDENATFKTVEQPPVANNNNAANNNRLPNECYPKDVLTPGDLLPQDANSTWAQTVPSGQGNLGDQNFLNAGFHVGINTVGQSLRNANLQLRSEPPNPQLKVSPWLQTTIDPDVNRKAFEIGEA